MNRRYFIKSGGIALASFGLMTSTPPFLRRLLLAGWWHLAAGAGSERQRSRFWAKPLEQLNDELGVKIRVRHFPAATTRWSRLDCRQFSIIVKSDRGRPVARHQAIVSLIGNT